MSKLDKLHELLIPWIFNYSVNLVLTNLKLNSRDIELGNLFIAIKGCKTDGRLYIDHAISKGAIAVLSESEDNTFSIKYICDSIKLIPIISFNKLKQNISNIAGRFYGYPSLLLHLIGVTGTNGKTTITHLLANWVELIGEKSAIIGTLGNGVLNHLHSSSCTTCSSIETQQVLTQFVQNKIKFVAMEVSSHGLDQYRVDALYFNVAIFSNLSYDHLDYHSDIKKYEIAKWRLFNELHVEHYVINADDHVGYQWLSYLPNAVAVTMTNNLPKSWSGKWIYLIKANYSINRTDIIFNSSWGDGVICSQLLGSFNVNNLLLALGALLVIGYPLPLLLSKASQLRPVCGRVEVFRSYKQPTVIVDYAHTPDALEKVLNFAKRFCRRHLWCIFGCGGNRDRSKRALMGLVAERYSNYIIITNDNPRTENSQSIINDIIVGIKYSNKIKIIKDRACAIRTAISQAHSEDFVLIFGKGHEIHQIIGNDYVNYSDQNIVKNFFNK